MTVLPEHEIPHTPPYSLDIVVSMQEKHVQDQQKTIGDHWSKKTASHQAGLKLRWWQSELIVRHINRLVCGDDIAGFSQGLVELVRSRAAPSLPFGKGISVGGGTGQKEMGLMRQGIVHRFDIYEYSDARIQAGIQLAEKAGLEGRVRFIHGDAFELVDPDQQYDFVHWNNSLHHMLDVDRAVAWSKGVLRTGGLFYMDDFIGASRFQWPDQQLEIATRIRHIFKNTKYMAHPRAPADSLPAIVSRPNKDKLIANDPSEAADSERIVEALYKHFPNVEVKATGGVVYHLALSDMLHNFNEETDRALIDLLMLVDELCLRLGQTHYGVALAFKE